MFVDEYGPVSGAPVTFLHGAMVAGWMWRGQAENLAEYRCLLPDFPGIGHSGDERWISLADTADKIAAMIRARCADGSTHLVGLSLGGVISLHVAVRHPDTIRSLLLSGVPYGTIPFPLRALSKMMVRLYNSASGARAIAQMMGIPADESREAFVQTALQTKPQVMQAITSEINRSPLPAGLENVTAPTLAVVGTKDTGPAKRAVPYLVRVMPNASGYLVPDVGHQWNAEQPELFSEMVRAWVSSKLVVDRLIPIAQR